MALLYKAQIVPSKLEALAGWLPGRAWAGPVDGPPTQVGSYRFDDPEGAVGIETLLVRTAAGRLLQVPLTYRSAPLAGAEDALVATLDHSVLGPRWAYDGCADPVAVRALLDAVLTGGHEAVLEVDTGSGTPERWEPTVRVAGTGRPGTAVPAVDAVRRSDTDTATVVEAGGVALTLRRLLDGAPAAPAGPALLGTWPGVTTPTVLASLRTPGRAVPS